MINEELNYSPKEKKQIEERLDKLKSSRIRALEEDEVIPDELKDLINTPTFILLPNPLGLKRTKSPTFI